MLPTKPSTDCILAAKSFKNRVKFNVVTCEMKRLWHVDGDILVNDTLPPIENVSPRCGLNEFRNQVLEAAHNISGRHSIPVSFHISRPHFE
jgi:hypothetical protein